jgi:hypothetical protein
VEPELQKFSAVAIVGLLAFFPVFNQVKDTVLDTLSNADHEGTWSSFFKDWDEIPNDERLEYWDGRNKPPGGDGDFDRDRLDRDARIGNGNGGSNGNGGDEDGSGRNTTDDETDTEPRYQLVEIILWERSFNGRVSDLDEIIEVERPVESLNFTWNYSQWTGHARFELYADGSRAWDKNYGSSQVPMVLQTQISREAIDGTGTALLRIDWDYNPVTEPNRFDVSLRAMVKEYLE